MSESRSATPRTVLMLCLASRMLFQAFCDVRIAFCDTQNGSHALPGVENAFPGILRCQNRVLRHPERLSCSGLSRECFSRHSAMSESRSATPRTVLMLCLESRMLFQAFCDVRIAFCDTQNGSHALPGVENAFPGILRCQNRVLRHPERFSCSAWSRECFSRHS